MAAGDDEESFTIDDDADDEGGGYLPVEWEEGDVAFEGAADWSLSVSMMSFDADTDPTAVEEADAAQDFITVPASVMGGGLCTDVPPTQRAEALRAFLGEQLGDDLFLQVYRLLDEQQSGAGGGNDEEVEARLETLLGPRRRLGALVGQLLWCEEQAHGAHHDDGDGDGGSDGAAWQGDTDILLLQTNSM